MTTMLTIHAAYNYMFNAAQTIKCRTFGYMLCRNHLIGDKLIFVCVNANSNIKIVLVLLEIRLIVLTRLFIIDGLLSFSLSLG